jgi:hypothetical protein
MKSGEKTRLHQAIYAKNSGPDGLTTVDIIAGCEKADHLLSDEFVAMAKASPFYFENQQDQ